ncbi:MAG: PilN domain-containing protein [Myxococcota bacterium]
MIRINLLPIEDKRSLQAVYLQLALMGIIVFLTLFMTYLVYNYYEGEISALEVRLQQTQAEVKRLDKIIGQVSEYEARLKELKQKLEVIEQLKKGKSGPVRLMEDLTSRIPTKVWITEFKESHKRLELKGLASSDEDVALFLAELERSPYFEDVKLDATEIDAQTQYKKFTLTCTVKYAL